MNSINIHGSIFPHQDLQLLASCKILNGYLKNTHARIDDFTVGIATQYFVKQLAWLYDLSTMKWTILGLPHWSIGRPTYDDPYNTKDL